jgi:GH35 family endo-1,4-beta-xylanase
MKYKNKILLFAVLSMLILGLNSCYDEKMEWSDPYTHPESKDLPLQLQEKISRYEALNAYTHFTLGVGIDLSLYMNDETYRNTVNANFDEITVGYDMKHGAMVSGAGALNFTKVDALIAKLKQAGLTVYGHTLTWHQNQNASYLNGLIAPEIIPSAGESQLDVAALLDGSFTGWSRNNAGGITIVQNAGLGSSDPAIRFETTKAGNEWDTQLTSPEIPAVVDHKYSISFWTKSEDAGQWRMSFAGMDNNYPWNGGGALFNTSGTWTQITYEQTATAAAIKVAFDVGKVPGVYFVDINSISVIDLDAAPTEVNLVENGDFESGDFGNWSQLNKGTGMSVTEEAKFSGSYGAKITSSATSANEWDLQLESPNVVLDKNKTYTFSFYVKSDVAGTGRISFPGDSPNQYPWMNWTGTGASGAFTTPAGVWTLISVELSGYGTFKLSFDMGKLPNVTYYIDDVKIVEQPAVQSSPALRAGPTIIDKTPEEKAAIIGAALEDWISEMVGHYKNDVHAWDVVNEPMDDGKPSSLKTGVNKTLAADEFYWQDYLGKDYAVTAFNLARQYGNANDKLFINDYNLEQSLAKCDGLIEYVKYIESKGAKVDGIGTQMHLSINSSKANIEQMFQKLAQTGKLIKISELDITVGTASPTAADLAQQAEMYQYVIDMYMKYIPENQRYGATVWCVSDNADEHTNWLPDDAPCLWNADYERKHAYKGFADGLAGKDVSADFTGDLQY